MDKSSVTIISSTTLASGETTDLSSCTAIDNSRSTQLSVELKATINAAATGNIFVYMYTSSDDTTYSDTWHDSWEINNCREVGFTSGDFMWMPEEQVTAAAGGTGTIVGWELDSGTWAGGDAQGTIYLEDISGTFTDGQALTGGTSGCSALQSGDIAAHAITREYYSMAPTPLYIKARIHNGDVTYDATLCSLVSIKQTI